MSGTVPIVYNAGAYGTYVEWCLTTLCSNQTIITPFNANGNSHGFTGNFLSGLQGWQQYKVNRPRHQFVRLHPKNLASESLSANLTEILQSAPGMVYLYPDHDHMLLVLNNYLSKCHDDWWLKNFAEDIDQSKIYSNWQVGNKSISEIPLWVRREFLSFYLMPAWHDQIEWYHLDTWMHPRSHNILIKDLLFDFERVMRQLQQAFGFKFARPIQDLLPYHEKNLALQVHQTQDQLCQNIVDSVVHGIDFDWSNQPLPLASEAYVQWQLRNLGYEIRCHELDKFPTDSVHLKELLYTI
jgi:hypothetical protein